ncbi:MAG: HD domain-containing protein [Clostridia bacterium]|nr:HD domain-containing protein [Clostridia bacterium]
MKDLFKNYQANEQNPKWENIIKREIPLYARKNDIRSEFERDYTRIIHSQGYRRLKHKTQVYFSPENDHICTRIEHVMHVESISYTIAKYLGLNTELTKAIATAHDIGHSPFGHEGERILSQISLRDIGQTFWHEKNGLDFVDKVELLEDNKKNFQNLNLTYAVRDGIISHCGEIDENALKPREEAIDLCDYTKPNEYAPYTWEGCVVKISDKISYLGRDIEDAITVGILDEHLEELYELLNTKDGEIINNTVIINELVYDLCQNSTPEKGLCFSEEMYDKINKIKKFNYKYIYSSEKVKPCIEYYKLVLNQIYDILKASYNNFDKYKKMYPSLINEFYSWFERYSIENKKEQYHNAKIFDIKNEKDFCQAIIYYIAGMTDNYAIKSFESIVKF